MILLCIIGSLVYITISMIIGRIIWRKFWYVFDPEMFGIMAGIAWPVTLVVVSTSGFIDHAASFIQWWGRSAFSAGDYIFKKYIK